MEIHCTYKELVPIEKLSIEMCKGLKVRFKRDLKEEARMLLTHGMLTPIFVWENAGSKEVVDGIGRILAIKHVNSFFYGLDSQGQLEEGAGEKISDIPVIYIAAENFDEARKKAVLVNSMFGKINREEMVRYAEEISFTPDYITAHQSYFVGSHMPAEVNVDIPFAGEVDKAEVALPSSAGDDIFQPSSYTPSIDIGEVDKAEVEKAEAKIKNTDNKKQKPLREITCRHCGHVFHIGE